MEYIEKTTDEKAEETASGKIREIHKRICLIRKSEKAGVKYMQKWEEIAYARQDGREEGRAEEIIASGFEFKLSKQEILEKLEGKLKISIEEAQEYLKKALSDAE